MSPFRTVAALSAAALVLGALAATTGASARTPDPTEPAQRLSYDGPVSLVLVHARTQEQRSEVVQLGLDATTKVTRRGLEVLLYGPADEDVLRDAGYDWTVLVDDLGAQARARVRADRAYADRVDRSRLPSGSTAYRHLRNVNSELRELHERFPHETKLLTLEHPSVEGRPVRGIEITTDAARINDGKPVFLLMGAHHAREWPGVEHALEYAYDLLQSARRPTGDPRADAILERSRTIIVPVVNVDGFAISRNARPRGDFSRFDYEMKRKNCDLSDSAPPRFLTGPCDHNRAGRLRGTDLNRNYPGFWGGPGADADWSSDVFRGDGPGSEPEVDNIRQLVSQRQVVSLLSLHTYSNLVLRPPSIADTGRPPDEVAYRTLADRMAQANGYLSEPAYELYDTSGSVEDWSYWNTGGYGFTFEIGGNAFHPPYRRGVVAEYLGREPAPGAGRGGNREAFYRLSMATVRAAGHSVISGRAPEGFRLDIHKQFVTATSPVLDENGNPGPPRYYEDELTSTYDSTGGPFRWAVNPSTRPLVVGRYGRDPVAPPQDQLRLRNPAGVPDPRDVEEAHFRVVGPPDADNGVALVRIGWDGPRRVDWDVQVYDPHGVLVAEARTLDNPEVARLIDPIPGRYTVEVQNYARGDAADWSGSVTFRGPEPASYSGITESWMLTCTDESTGDVVGSREVVVDRGETARVGQICSPDVRKD